MPLLFLQLKLVAPFGLMSATCRPKLQILRRRAQYGRLPRWLFGNSAGTAVGEGVLESLQKGTGNRESESSSARDLTAENTHTPHPITKMTPGPRQPPTPLPFSSLSALGVATGEDLGLAPLRPNFAPFPETKPLPAAPAAGSGSSASVRHIPGRNIPETVPRTPIFPIIYKSYSRKPTINVQL